MGHRQPTWEMFISGRAGVCGWSSKECRSQGGERAGRRNAGEARWACSRPTCPSLSEEKRYSRVKRSLLTGCWAKCHGKRTARAVGRAVGVSAPKVQRRMADKEAGPLEPWSTTLGPQRVKQNRRRRRRRRDQLHVWRLTDHSVAPVLYLFPDAADVPGALGSLLDLSAIRAH